MAKPRKTFKIGNKSFKIGDKVEILCWDSYKYVRKNGFITYVIRAEQKPTKKDLFECYGDILGLPEEFQSSVNKAIKRTRVRLYNPTNSEGYYVVPVIDEKFINKIDKVEPDVDIPVKMSIDKIDDSKMLEENDIEAEE